jgi:hypothetical protein
VRTAWRPESLPAPQLADDVTSLPAVERTAEILRYRLLRLEYALSPTGMLRAWFKLMFKTAVVIGIPVMLLGPLLIVILAGIAVMTESLAHICINLLKAVAAIVAIGAVVAVAAAMCRR